MDEAILMGVVSFNIHNGRKYVKRSFYYFIE